MIGASPARPVIDDAGFVVELERFQGPLDLLLHLIRSQDVDIFDIPVAQITSQFLRAVEGVELLGLDRAGEFLEMAATLIRIKAQMLMPRRGGEGIGGEDPRAELVRRLLEYEHFRELARRLEDKEADRSRHYRRGHVPPRPERVEQPVELELAWQDLWDAAAALDERAGEPREHRILRRAVSVDEKVGLILQALGKRARVDFSRLVSPFGDRLHAVVTLLAGLELSKRHELVLRQARPFAQLWLYRRGEEKDASDTDH